MYFITEQSKILQVDDAYATLKSINDDGTLTFDFRYSLSQIEAMRSNAMSVKVTVYTKTIAKRPLMGTSHVGQIDAKTLVNNILTDMTAAKTALKNQDNYTLCTRNSDITSKINNEIASKLKTRGSTSTQQLTKTRLKTVAAGTLKRSNDSKPVLHIVKNSRSSGDDQTSVQELCKSLIVDRGVDPSQVAYAALNTITANRSFTGMANASSQMAINEDRLVRLRDSLTSVSSVDEQKTTTDVDDQTMIAVYSTEQNANVDLVVSATFSGQIDMKTSDEMESVFVKFQLVRAGTGEIIDTVTKTLHVSQHIKVFQTPVRAPIVKVIRSDVASKANIEIRQADPQADSVKVYCKNVHVASTNVDQYALVGTIDVKNNQSAIMPITYPMYDSSVYRVISTCAGTIGNAYTNVIVRPRLPRRSKILSLTSKIVDTGVLIEARSLPSHIVSIQFMQRNLTTHDVDYVAISDPQLITDAIRTSDYVSVVATDVMHNNVYEYVVKAYQNSGESTLMGNEIIEYVAITSGKVNIHIENLNVDHSDAEPEVTFNITIDVVNNDLDIVRTLLSEQDVQKYFESDIAQQREQLKNLFTYAIERIDVTTGDRINMGILTGTSFSDKAIRRIHSIDSLRYGHAYRYAITALSRAPETLLASTTRTVVDAATKKKYTFYPAKFLHPITLSEGTIVSDVGLKNRYSKSPFMLGNLGVTTFVDVTLDLDSSKVLEASVQHFDYSHNIVTWRTSGDLSDVDHFVIMKEVHGVSTILGVAHNQFANNNCEWIHELSSDDNGELRYAIVIVMNDYKYGEPVYTNSMLIEVS